MFIKRLFERKGSFNDTAIPSAHVEVAHNSSGEPENTMCENKSNLFALGLTFLIVCLCNTAYSNGISREYLFEKDKTKKGYHFSIVPVGISGEMIDGVGPWAGIGANYRRLDSKNYASIYPIAGYWIALLGASASLQPIYDLDKGSFDGLRGRINLTVLFFSVSIFHDYKESTNGITAGLEIPIPIKFFRIKDKREP